MSNEPVQTSPATQDAHAYMPQLDGLRAIAVSFVLLEHYAHPEFFPFGTMGVAMFFVLSGYLITKILLSYRLKAGDDPKQRRHFLGVFYQRRALRIFPLYYLAGTLLWLAPFVHVANYVPHFTFTQNFYFFLANNWSEPSGHTWTLAVEEQFYLIWPLLMLFLPFKAIERCIYIFIVGGVVFRLWAFGYLYPQYGLIGLLTPSSFDAFGLGAWLAYTHFYREPKYAFEDWRKWLIGLAGISTVYFLFARYEPFNYGVTFLFILSVLSVWLISQASVGRKGLFEDMLSSAPLRFIGRISYGIYVFHLPAVSYYTELARLSVERGWHRPGSTELLFPAYPEQWKLAIAYTVITVLLAIISYYLMERPILRLKANDD
jgi:peptidoglycan/LPS O-acetylase OafA/YrhL